MNYAETFKKCAETIQGAFRLEVATWRHADGITQVEWTVWVSDKSQNVRGTTPVAMLINLGALYGVPETVATTAIEEVGTP